MRLQPNDAILYESLGKDTHTHENTRPEYNKSTTDSGQKGAVGGGHWRGGAGKTPAGDTGMRWAMQNAFMSYEQ